MEQKRKAVVNSSVIFLQHPGPHSTKSQTPESEDYILFPSVPSPVPCTEDVAMKSPNFRV